MMTHQTLDIIDSRDVIDRIEELEAELYDLEAALNKNDPDTDEEEKELALWKEENAEELEALQKLAEEAGDSPDWIHGEILILESYFVDYCEELCREIGEIHNLPWYIADHIDWEGVARELKQDYMEVDFDGQNYLIRA